MKQAGTKESSFLKTTKVIYTPGQNISCFQSFGERYEKNPNPHLGVILYAEV